MASDVSELAIPARSPGILRWIDPFLSESLRRASPVELSRARVVGGAAFILLPLGVLFLFFSLLTMPHPWLIAGVTAVTLLGVAGSLVLLRRDASPRSAALLLCAAMELTFLPSTLPMNEPYAGAHPSAMLLPLLAVYLLGGRIGLIFTGFSGLSMLVFPFFYRHAVPDFPRYFGIYLFAALCLLGGWAIGRLHGLARDEAQRALEQTLKELSESQRQMSSLIESTDDIVFSVDTQSRVLIANQTASREFHRRYGKGLRRGETFLDVMSPQAQARWRGQLEQVLAGQAVKVEDVASTADAHRVLSLSLHPIPGEQGQPVGATVFARDITARTEAEAKLARLHRQLMDVSRQAGMAEIATGVLHNVGNTLNSVNVSAVLLSDRVRNSRVEGLAKASALLQEHAQDLGTFLTSDPRGSKLPAYFTALAGQLIEERNVLAQELSRLTEGVEHIKSIVSMQQAHAQMSGVVELLPVPQLIDDALRLNADSFERRSIQVRREYQEVPPILVDRHKLLQILVNLLSNARHALTDSGREDKVLTIRIRPGAEKDRLRIEVADNGVGIPPELRQRIFAQGFTTKKNGHGFGLHMSALAAAELGGTLTCESAGAGQGAVFALELPVSGLSES